MKIFICCSKHFYHKIQPIKEQLEKAGHQITPPNSYDAPFKEEEMKQQSQEAHINWKANMIRLHEPTIRAHDAILALNFEKNGQPNYIGGATFLETAKAFELGKKIFFYNPLPDSIFKDELTAFNPTIIHANLTKII